MALAYITGIDGIRVKSHPIKEELLRPRTLVIRRHSAPIWELVMACWKNNEVQHERAEYKEEGILMSY